MSSNQTSEQTILIAEYTLGLSNLQEAAQAQALLGKDKNAVVTALKWENRFLDLVDQLPPVEPSAAVLQRIQAALGQEITSTPSQGALARIGTKVRAGTWSSLWFWRALSVILALTALVYTANPKLIPAPSGPNRVAILQAPGQTSTPGWIVTVGAQYNLAMEPQVHIDVPPDGSVQLWTRSGNAPQPRSLGIIEPNRPVTVPATSIGEISADQLFEMTLEAKGGSPTGSPTGPILFIGRMVTLGE